VKAVRPNIVNAPSFGSVTEFPWIAAILDATEPDPFQAQFCGGARLAPTKIVTAAHCMVDSVESPLSPSGVEVLVGVSDLFSGARLPVASIAIHPAYNPATSLNDVAIITLGVASPGPTVEVMTLAAENNSAPGSVARIAGWGCTSLDVPIRGNCNGFESDLLAASVPIQSTSVCGRTVPGFIPSGMLCAGSVSFFGEAPDACYGDSGGPLVVRGARGSLIAGVVSYGDGCGGSPTAYTRLAVHSNWLASNGVLIRPAPFRPGQAIPQVQGAYGPVAGDFNGDGRSDVFWNAPAGRPDALWLGSPSGPRPGPTPRNSPTGAQPVVGDFNADGRGDIFWYTAGAAPEVMWRGGGTGGFTPVATLQVGSAYRPLVGNFRGGVGDDIFWYAPGAAPEALWVSGTNGSLTPSPVANIGNPYSPVVGDFDANNFDDVYWFAPGAAAEGLWLSNGTTFISRSTLQVGGNYRLLAGDYDGDRHDDLLFYGPGAAPDSLWRGVTGGTYFNRPTDVQVSGTYATAVGDFDGDVRSDVLWFGAGPVPDGWWAGITVG